MRAEVLAATGSIDRSYQWFAGISHLRRGELSEKKGQRKEAARHYARALAIWEEADDWYADLREYARTSLRRVTGESNTRQD